MSSLSISNKLSLFALMMILFLCIGGGVSLSQVLKAQSTWISYQDNVATRLDIILDLKKQFGYGGAIHNFKNLVLRGNDPVKRDRYYERAHSQFQAVIQDVDRYSRIEGLSGDEKEAIATVRRTAMEYYNNIDEALKASQQGRPIFEVDGVVKVNDTPALEAFEVLQKAYKQLSEEKSHEFEEMVSQTKMVLGVTFLVMLVFAFATGFKARESILKKIHSMGRMVGSMAAGDLTQRITLPEKRDELDHLAQAINQMADSLNRYVLQSRQGNDDLTQTTSQIAATSAQLAASSSETSTTIAEVVTTVEEVRHTAQMSTDKSRQLVEQARELLTVSQQGEEASAQAIEGISTINEEMVYIAESTIKLSEQSQNIGEIIDAVNDLADQSNLLSVNAAIEAAKAGEAGKGFSVVAQEVKSLAVQSREATGQIRSILNDIQKATAAAVLATERGSKAVDAGVALSRDAGMVIVTLKESVESSATAAEQINASSQQQFAGMDQLVVAMSNIKDATAQNVHGARQLEQASQALDSLSRELKSQGEQFVISSSRSLSPDSGCKPPTPPISPSQPQTP